MATSDLVSAFKAQNPDAYNAIFQAGAESVSQSQFEAGKTAGAQAERETLKSVAGADVFTAEGYIAAFGDKGARAYLEKKPYATLVTEQIADLNASHAAAITAKDQQIADLTAKLAAMPRGNGAASFQAEKKNDNESKPAKAADGTLTYSNGAKVGEGNARERVAAAIKLPA